MTRNHDTDAHVSPLAPAAPNAPLADIRRRLLGDNRDAIKKGLAKKSIDLPVTSLVIPGGFTVYVRYLFPSISHFNRLQQVIALNDQKGTSAAMKSVLVKFLIQQCAGVYLVPDDQPDLFLSLDLAVDPDKATDPKTWPTFETGWQAIAEALEIDGITKPTDLVKAMYLDGRIEGTSQAILREAGYMQGN